MNAITRNVAHLFAAIALTAAAAAPALAQEATPDAQWLPATVKSTTARADVLAQLKAARADGSIKAWSAGYIEPVKSLRSREDVRLETQAALSSGEVAQINAAVRDGAPTQPVASRPTLALAR